MSQDLRSDVVFPVCSPAYRDTLQAAGAALGWGLPANGLLNEGALVRLGDVAVPAED